MLWREDGWCVTVPILSITNILYWPYSVVIRCALQNLEGGEDTRYDVRDNSGRGGGNDGEERKEPTAHITRVRIVFVFRFRSLRFLLWCLTLGSLFSLSMTYIHTYTHTHIYTCIHTYIHSYTYSFTYALITQSGVMH